MTQFDDKKIYLVDGNAYIHRAYHAIPLLTTSSGMPINAVFGFVRMIFKILKNFRPLYFCICFDSEKPTFRHKIYKEYKSTRKKLDDEIKVQFPIVSEFVKISELPHLVVEGYEADDIISFLVNKFKREKEIIIISGDKDILQLVEDRVIVYNEHKDIWYRPDDVKKKYGVEPKMLTDFFALVGDKVDNIPGVKGVGPKTAAELLLKYGGSIESIYENIDKLSFELKERFLSCKTEVIKSKQLIQLSSDIPELDEFSLDEIKITNLNFSKIKEFLIKYEFKSILRELEKLSIYSPQENQTTNITLDLFSFKQIGEKKEPVSKTEIVSATNIGVLHDLVKEYQKIYKISFLLIYSHKTKEIIGSILETDFGSQKKRFFILLTEYKNEDGDLLLPVDKTNFLLFLNGMFNFENVNIITYDIKSQLKLLQQCYLIDTIYKLNNVFDILLLSHLLEPNKKINSLQELVDIWIGNKPVTEPVLPKEVDIKFLSVEKIMIRFENTLETMTQVFVEQQKKLEEYDLVDVYKTLELPMVKVIIKMENNGILVDKKYAEELKNEIENKILECKTKIFEIAGTQFNLNSPKQLAFILFEKLQLPPVKKKKTGFSTDEEVLQKLRNAHPIVEFILQYREFEKLKNTYIEPIISYINPNTMRVHTNFNLTGTATGRLSSEEPNLQNIPVKTEVGRKVRKLFVAQEGYNLVSFDYSQIELRILAHFSGDRNLISAFFDNIDIHKLTATEIFGIKQEKVTDELRRVAKIINFGIIYGMTPQGLAKELNIPIEVAEEYIKKYFDKYSQVKEWIEQTIKFAKQNGFVRTLLGRIRQIPEINSPNKQISFFGERLAVNTPIQGTAADIIKLAMIKIDEYIENKNLNSKVKMLLQIHDELLFEIDKQVLQDSVKRIKDIMENVVKLKVPLVVDIKISDRWES